MTGPVKDPKRVPVVLTEEDKALLPSLAGKSPGVYRYTTISTIGTADTTKRKLQIIDYYVNDFRPDEDGLVQAQIIDYTGKPIQMFDKLTPKQASMLRLICDDINEFPLMLQRVHMLKTHIRIANEHYEKKEYNSAEYEYDNALKIDGNNVEAAVGKGNTLFKMQRYEEARSIFDELSNNPELYIEEHKHLFNEYGISLRKLDMYDKAIESYKRAILVSRYDPHLYFNLAVAYAKKGDRTVAIKLLNRAIELKKKLESSGFPEATLLLEKLKGGIR